jgi:hypothetical protein
MHRPGRSTPSRNRRRLGLAVSLQVWCLLVSAFSLQGKPEREIAQLDKALTRMIDQYLTFSKAQFAAQLN